MPLATVCRLVVSLALIAAVLLTGDRGFDEAESAYQRLDQAIPSLGVPSFWLPGNHDALWSEGHTLYHNFQRSVNLPRWDVLTLNT